MTDSDGPPGYELRLLISYGPDGIEEEASPVHRLLFLTCLLPPSLPTDTTLQLIQPSSCSHTTPVSRGRLGFSVTYIPGLPWATLDFSQVEQSQLL